MARKRDARGAALVRSDARVWLLSLVLLAVSGAALVEAQDGPAGRLAQLHVPAEVLASGVNVSTAGELVAAMANPDVSLAVIWRDVLLRERDFAPYATPFDFTGGRNLTLLGAFSSPAEYPAVDFGFVKDKVQLGQRSRFELTRLVLVRSREAPQWQAPGLDLCLIGGDGSALPSASVTATLALVNSILVQRGCLPRAASDESMSRYPRPTSIPGKQNYTRNYDQTGCTNATGAPWANRCYPAVSMYTDIATWGANVGSGDKPVAAGYLLSLLEIPQACSLLLTDECVSTYGPTGCFYRAFPRLNGSDAADAPPPPAAPSTQLEVPEAASSNGSDNKALLAGLIGGLLGGLLLLALVAALVWLVRKRQQREPRAAVYSKSSSCSAKPFADPSTHVATVKTAAALTDDTQPSSDTLHALADAHLGGAVSSAAVVSAAELAFVPVTPLTPVLPGINLECGEVELTNETLGRGAFGRVVVGRYLCAQVAVKLLDLGLLRMDMVQAQSKTPDGGAEAREVLADGSAEGGGEGSKRQAADVKLTSELPAEERALRQEVEILARCCHPSIVRLLAANTKPPRLCLVMERMETSLERLVHGEGATLLPLPTVLHISSQVASALAYLHPTILHRDLKPGNILISNANSPRPTAKLADFGLSRLLSTVLITRNPEVGTAPYMAPEAFDLGNHAITDKVDIYAFGVLVWEMLTGERPWSVGFDGGPPNVVMVAYAVTVQRRRPPLASIPRQRCPLKLEALIEACWDPDPARRPCAAEVAKRLALITELLAQPDSEALLE